MHQEKPNSEQKAKGEGIAQAIGDGANANVNVFKPGRGCNVEFGRMVRVTLFFSLMLAFLAATFSMQQERDQDSTPYQPLSPKETEPVAIPQEPVPPITTREASVPAVVTIENIPCYTISTNGIATNGVKITISKFVIVGILAQDSTGNWVQVRVNEVVECWVELRFLELNNIDLNSLPIVTILTPDVSTSTIVFSGEATPFPLLIQWKVSSYDCLGGTAIGATIGLDVSGGVPGGYKFTPDLPIYGQPGQVINVTVNSNTSDGKPDGAISFTIPEAKDTSVYQCKNESASVGTNAQSENVTAPPPAPTDPPPPTEPPPDPGDPPTEEPPPVCYNPQGHEIPCKKK